MDRTNICPVPKQQIPLVEYQDLSESWFFTLPTSKDNKFIHILFLSWLIMICIIIIISTGSYQLRENIPILLILSLFSGLLLPLLIIIRQWLAWNYILNRLKSENIEYEKSGWYDGQVWEKPINLRSRDLLIAQHEVIPIISSLKKPLLLISCLELFGIVLSLF